VQDDAKRASLAKARGGIPLHFRGQELKRRIPWRAWRPCDQRERGSLFKFNFLVSYLRELVRASVQGERDVDEMVGNGSREA